MVTRLIKHELSARSVMQYVPHRDCIEKMKELALELAEEYDGPIKVELNVNPEHTMVRMHVQEFDL